MIKLRARTWLPVWAWALVAAGWPSLSHYVEVIIISLFIGQFYANRPKIHDHGQSWASLLLSIPKDNCQLLQLSKQFRGWSMDSILNM